MSTNGSGPALSLREKAISFIINSIVKLTNKKVDVGALQDKFGAHEGKVLEMRLVDINKNYYFRIFDGELQYLVAPSRRDGGFETTSDTIINLATQKCKRMDPATGEIFEMSYSPMDAVVDGSVHIWGEAATNDMLLFTKAVYTSVFPTLRGEIAAAASGGGKVA